MREKRVEHQSLEAEQLCLQGSSKRNEDRTLVYGNTFGVFDGSSSLFSLQGEKGGGEIAAELAAGSFDQAGSLFLQLQKANQRLNSLQKRVGISKNEERWATSLALLRLHSQQIEWLSLGDCRIVLLKKGGGYLQANHVMDHDRETLALQAQLGGRKAAANHPQFLQQLRKVRSEMNRSYGVLNGDPAAISCIQHGFLRRELFSAALLFSDGIHFPGEKSLEQIVQHYIQSGVAGLVQAVRKWQSSDPDCRLVPRFKCHDDISVVAVSL